jgi:hypothetical protein
LLLQLWLFYFHIIIQNKIKNPWTWDQTLEPTSCEFVLDQIDVNNLEMEQAHEWLPITSYLLTKTISHQIELGGICHI